MNHSVRTLIQQPLGRGTGTGKTLYGVVMGVAVLVLIAGVALAVAFILGPSDGPQLAAPDASSQSFGALSGVYAPIDAYIGGIVSDCCSHVAAYQFESATAYAESGR